MKTKKELILENVAITVGTIFLNIGFYFFFAPNNLVTGGVLGTATILNNFNIPLSASVFVLNVMFLILGFAVLGKNYGIRTIYASLLTPLITGLLEVFEVPQDLITSQLSEAPILMSAVIGSIFTGFGLGIVFRNNGSTGGIDILQNILHKKVHLDYKTIFILTDGIIVLFGLIVFKDLQAFFYAIGAILLFSLIIDNLSIAGRAGHTLFIVTKKSEVVKEAIYKELERGTTIIDVKGGYSSEDKKLVICVINKKQLNLARHVVAEADPEAFTFIAQTKEAVGLGFTHH